MRFSSLLAAAVLASSTLAAPVRAADAPALLENLRTRIAARPLDPKLDGDAPATWETAVRVTLTVTPETGSVSVDEIVDMPQVVRMTQVRFTEDMSGGAIAWDGRVIASCTVSVKGRCGPVEGKVVVPFLVERTGVSRPQLRGR